MGVDLNLKNVAVPVQDGSSMVANYCGVRTITSESAGASKPKALGPQIRRLRDCRAEKTASSWTACTPFLGDSLKKLTPTTVRTSRSNG